MWWMRLLLCLLLSAPIASGIDLKADGQPQAGEFVKEHAGTLLRWIELCHEASIQGQNRSRTDRSSQEKANHDRPLRHPEDSLVTFSWPVPMPDRNYIHCGILVKDI
jgi:hypothetical protein